MRAEEIVINQTGVSVLGIPVGFAPTAQDLELALEGQTVRSLAPLNERQLRICDSKGVSWLVDLKLDLVLWLDVLLAKLRYRQQDDHDAKDVFTGKVRIGQYTVQGPFSFETGEIVRKVVIPGLSLGFLPDERRIRAVTVAFIENERAVGCGKEK
jgi:hypothetical protein